MELTTSVMVAPALIDQGCALRNALNAVVDQGFDFLGRIGRATGQASDLGCDYRKASACSPALGGFNRCIERQNIGLKGNAIDDADDVGDPSWRRR